MKRFQTYLDEKLKDSEFQKLYTEERQLLEMSLRIAEAREQSGLSQKELAGKARITPRQLSRIEQGLNCNIMAFLKVCRALDLTLSMGGMSR